MTLIIDLLQVMVNDIHWLRRSYSAIETINSKSNRVTPRQMLISQLQYCYCYTACHRQPANLWSQERGFLAKMLRSKSLLWGLLQFFQQKFEHYCFALMPIMMASGGVRSAGPSFHYVRWDHDATQRGACACAHMAGQGAGVDSTSQQYILTSFVQDYIADPHILGQRIMRASHLHRVNSGAAVCVSAFNAAAVHASWCVLCVRVGVCNSTGTIATAEVQISASV